MVGTSGQPRAADWHLYSLAADPDTVEFTHAITRWHQMVASLCGIPTWFLVERPVSRDSRPDSQQGQEDTA